MHIVDPAGTHKGKDDIIPHEGLIPKLIVKLFIAKYFPEYK